jgi:diazepam-binding inhibitor (GABA receptor modulating acyl-CoA-binding protein)
MNFEEAGIKAKEITHTLDYTIKTKLYGLYKQGQLGDCNCPCPSIFYITENAKWYAWNKHKGMDQQHAQTIFIEEVTKLLKSS